MFSLCLFQVSLVGFLFLLGLYISSLASCMGGLYGAPRILQCIAQEKVIPILAFLGHGVSEQWYRISCMSCTPKQCVCPHYICYGWYMVIKYWVGRACDFTLSGIMEITVKYFALLKKYHATVLSVPPTRAIGQVTPVSQSACCKFFISALPSIHVAPHSSCKIRSLNPSSDHHSFMASSWSPGPCLKSLCSSFLS